MASHALYIIDFQLLLSSWNHILVIVCGLCGEQLNRWPPSILFTKELLELSSADIQMPLISQRVPGSVNCWKLWDPALLSLLFIRLMLLFIPAPSGLSLFSLFEGQSHI